MSTTPETTERPTFNGLPVKRVTVAVRLAFEAYVLDYDAMTEEQLADAHQDLRDLDDLQGQVAREVVDAITYHAGHGEDTEAGDALVSLASTGEWPEVDVEAVWVDEIETPEPFTSEHVAAAAHSMSNGF